MLINQYNPHSRYREKAAQKVANFISFLLVIAMSVGVGIWMGRQFGAESVITLKHQNKSLNTQVEELQTALTDLRAEAQTANTRYEQLRAEYNAAVPEGPMQDLLRLVKQQLDEGMEPGRLAFLIRSARPPTGCTEADSKRFIVSTPTYKGENSAVTIADGTVVIFGAGASAKNAQGQPEAWYDPAQGVTVTFKNAAGETEEKTGVLPIRHSVVVEDREYRFTIEEGSRSFARVVYDSCAYP
jgi:hypothetical protein